MFASEGVYFSEHFCSSVTHFASKLGFPEASYGCCLNLHLPPRHTAASFKS